MALGFTIDGYVSPYTGETLNGVYGIAKQISLNLDGTSVINLTFYTSQQAFQQKKMPLGPGKQLIFPVESQLGAFKIDEEKYSQDGTVEYVDEGGTALADQNDVAARVIEDIGKVGITDLMALYPQAFSTLQAAIYDIAKNDNELSNLQPAM